MLDRSTRLLAGGGVVLGGSPLRLFRLTAAGTTAVRAMAAGGEAAPSTLLDRLLDAGAIHPVPPADPGDPGPSDVTVVVPAWRPDPERLAAIVAACADAARVVVVDDASDPPVPDLAGATVVRRVVNGGPAAARNTALADVTTPLVAFVDVDVTPPAGWLRGLVGHFADEGVALVAPRVASADGAGPVAVYERAHSPLDLGPEPARVAPGTRVAYVPAAAVVARTEALRASGGFDEAFRSGEDVDLVWRLVEAGHRVRYEPAVVVHHEPRPSWVALARQRIGYGAAAGPLARRHPGSLAPVRMSGWTATVWVLLGAGRPRLALALAAATAVALVRKLPGVPPATSLRLALTGHALAGRQLAAAARRVWWPLVALAALGSRRIRVAALVAALDGLRDGGPARLLDDAAYGVGVWRGVLTTGDTGPLRPDLTDWPGRSQ